MADFPIASLVGKEDSSKFGFEQEDVGIRSEMEGGWVVTRARHTRRPRRTWTTGFTDISDADKALLEAFYNDKGTHTGFTYQLPVGGAVKETVNVRFKEVLQYKYAGYGDNFRWNIEKIVLEEV